MQFQSIFICVVVRLDGSIPIKYGLRLNMDEKYKTLKKHLSDLCSIAVNQLLLAEISGALVKVKKNYSMNIIKPLGFSTI